MMNRIKKALIVTLATLTVIGNTTSAPVQATECSEAVKAAQNKGQKDLTIKSDLT